MYEEYYGFVEPPFSLTPDPRFLYRSESHDVALQQVWQAIRRKEGFIVLTGDIGTGKTTISRTILEQFDPTTFTALILNPFLSVEELLREVLLSFGVASRDSLRTGRLASASKHELIRALHDFLLSLVPIHGSAVIIIDEAQHLSPEVLEEIRILSNLETNDQKLLQIVFVGQLNLLHVLRDARLRQLDQRISIRCLLRPLNRAEAEAYVTHRLSMARGATAVTFTPGALALVHAMSGGVPRMINLVCDRALMAGCEARASAITETHVAEAARALDVAVPNAANGQVGQVLPVVRRPGLRTRWAAALLLIGLTTAAVYLVGNPFSADDTAVLPNATAVPPQSLGVRPVAIPAIPETPLRMMPPPDSQGLFAVLIDTFASPREAAQAEASLRARSLPLYAVDLRFRDGVRRRLFVGRFATREEAEAVRGQLAAEFTAARVVTATTELWAD